MRYELNIDLVFPIKDEVSAWLMCVKAERCMRRASLIPTKSTQFSNEPPQSSTRLQDRPRSSTSTGCRMSEASVSERLKKPTLPPQPGSGVSVSHVGTSENTRHSGGIGRQERRCEWIARSGDCRTLITSSSVRRKAGSSDARRIIPSGSASYPYDRQRSSNVLCDYSPNGLRSGRTLAGR
jgi:hypothetical protein